MTAVFVSHPSDKLDHYFGARATEALHALADVRFNPEPRELSTAELVDAARGCEYLIAYRQTAGPETLFRDWPELRAFIRCAMDIRTVDVAAASAHGVLVTRASAGFVPAVAEWIVAMMVNLGRDLVRHVETAHRQEPQIQSMGRQLHGSTLGVIGLGRIGRHLAALAGALGMRVLASDPHAAKGEASANLVPLAVLLAESDFVVCLAPASAETENLMDAAAFAAMKQGAFFVNAARGELVDDDALLAALDAGHLGGAALDVGRAPDQMPTPALARHPRVLATPHMGGLTRPATEHQAMETVGQLAALLKGEPPPGAVNAADARRWRKEFPA
ncbi:MAG: hydroxyacid dehydrogenase [Burkholderiales bacterium]|nr:hydroxyacid dehydrogenase [Burkholderiales bacterium]